MAHNIEPMDIEHDFDNKENTFHLNNVLPCTEKGYEELDVSELNMKLRYSTTPASSPMSKSYTANCLDNRNPETADGSLNVLDNMNLTRSFNSTMSKTDNMSKSLKVQPLQLHSAEQSLDNNRNASVLQPLDMTLTYEGNKIIATTTEANIDNTSFPSSPSPVQTPEVTKELPRSDGSSPIMRGLKSVLNMFRSSQSPIPSAECDGNIAKHDISSSGDTESPQSCGQMPQVALASTPIASCKSKERTPSKRNSPHKESVIFNDDLEKELLWKDETTILFSQEKIPIHKLFFQQSKPSHSSQAKEFERNIVNKDLNESLNETVQYMDISYNDSAIQDKTMTDLQVDLSNNNVAESDGEFVDCETTFTNQSDLFVSEENKCNNNFMSGTSETNKDTLPIIITQDIGTKLDVDLSGSRPSITSATFSKDPLDGTIPLKSSDTFAISPILAEQSLDAKVTSESLDRSLTLETFPNDKSEVIHSHSKPDPTERSFDLTTCTNSKITQDFDIHFDARSGEGLLNKTIITDEMKRSAVEATFIKEVLDDTELQLATDGVGVTLNEYIKLDIENQFSENKHLNATTTIDSAEKSDITTVDNMENRLKENCDQVSLDATLDIDPTKTPRILDTCINDYTQEIEDQFNINPLNICLDSAIDSNKNSAVQSVTVCANIDISNEQIDNSLLTDVSSKNNNQNVSIQSKSENLTFIKQEDVEFNCVDDSAKYLDATVTTVYPEVNVSCTKEKKSVDVSIEIDESLATLTALYKNTNTGQCKVEPETLCATNYDEDSSTKSPDSSKIISEITEFTCPIVTTQIKAHMHTDSNTALDLTQLAIENIDEIKINDPILDTSRGQVNSNFNATSVVTQNPDILYSNTCNYTVHNDMTNNLYVDKVGPLADENISKDPLEVSEVPADIPLPDGDDIETETATESLLTDNKSVSMILPDVINVLHTSNVEDVNKESVIKIETTKKINGVAQNENIDSIQPSIENTLEEKNVSGELNEISQATPAPKIESTKYLTDNTNEILTKTHSIYENVMEPDLSTSIVNNSVDQQIALKMEIAADMKNNSNLEKSYNEDVNFKINRDESDEIPETASTVNKSICEGTGKQNILSEIKPLEVPNSNKEFRRDEAQYSYETELHSSSMAQSPEVLQNDVSLDKMEIDKPLQINEMTNLEESIITNIHATHTTENDIKNEGNLYEELLDSENNSPFVVISIDKNTDNSEEENFDNVDNPFATKSKLSVSPPVSPKIVSKGYNFDFDEIEDPFATKAKIRMSPPPESPKMFCKSASAKKASSPKSELFNKNKRRTQSERKKPVSTKKADNSTLGAVSIKLNEMASHENTKVKENVVNELNTNSTSLEIFSKEVSDCTSEVKLKNIAIDSNEIDKSELEINIDNKSKLDINLVDQFEVTKRTEDQSPITSSSEQSAYYSAANSSGDSIVTKNVFNLPEMDDINFNPFVTKSKMRKSPSPDVNMTPFDPSISVSAHRNELNTTIIKNIDINQSAEKNSSSFEQKDSGNTSDTTCSSKATDDKDITVREVHTDDEDTIEGPFLEVEEFDNDKNPDLDNANVDMLQFTDLPAQTNEDNELFIDAEAFEFLLNQNKSNVVVDSGKESLFLKFDPLFAKRISSDGVVAALSKIQKRQSTPKKTTKSPQIKVANAESPIAGPSSSNVTLGQNTTEENTEDINITTSKPMMIVTPAVNPVVIPRKSMTPTNSNRRSITFTSPAIAVIDRLLSLSANNSLAGHDTTVTQVAREQNEADLALTQMRELLAEKEIHVYNLRSESKELRDRLTTLETQMKSLETQSEDRLRKVNELTAKLSEKTKINKSMATVVEEYERTIASLIAETEQDKKRHNEERMMLINERDEQTAHLASMEVSFSDLHSKYEKSKQLILSCKANEDTYKKSIKDFEENLAKMQNNYELLKQHATSKLNHANQELEKMNRAHEAEVLKLNAMIKRKDLHITSLEETLAQKTKANEELTAICDELINKVG